MNRPVTQYKLFMGHDTSSLLKNVEIGGTLTFRVVVGRLRKSRVLGA